MTKIITHAAWAGLAGLLPALAQAHEGHGMEGAHWHATDAWGFIAAVAIMVAAIWFSRGDK